MNDRTYDGGGHHCGCGDGRGNCDRVVTTTAVATVVATAMVVVVDVDLLAINVDIVIYVDVSINIAGSVDIGLCAATVVPPPPRRWAESVDPDNWMAMTKRTIKPDRFMCLPYLFLPVAAALTSAMVMRRASGAGS